ncbi:MAG: 1,4-dihydroxy-6-naphtoate synthase [Phycisphaerales bacterium]|nr:MAG: 1,4-dihydroxy-6-naphtoate synthase [Phycisphaerales bacterium]
MPTTDRIRLTLAHSPDADDMAMWWPLTGMIDPRGVMVREPAIDAGPFEFAPLARDVETLNVQAERQGLDVTAISAAAWPALADRYAITAAGGSFGEGYGPKVVVRADAPIRCEGCLRSQRPTIAVPGRHTTAALVLGLLLGPARSDVRWMELPFDGIAQAVLDGRADAGVLIHEAQLTFAGLGLREVVDLGRWWQQQAGCPLPLGLNVVRRDLEGEHGPGTLERIGALLRASVAYARAHPQDTRAYLSMHAQSRPEWNDAALLDRYLGMYVSDLTADMGDTGRRALAELYRRAHRAGLLEAAIEPVVV